MADLIVIIVYFLVILAVGLFARRMIRTEQDFVVAGRRLGPLLYGGTLCAVVLGGASTIGGVGLGYVYGLSGMWLVFAIGCGVMVLSICFAGTIRRLRVYTVGEMLELRYGAGARTLSGVIMALYTLLICVVSTIACGALLSASFGIGTVPAMILGGAVVLAYATAGGMWSVTLTDIVQFVITTVGIFLVVLPAAIMKAGGVTAMKAALPPSAFSLTAVGADAILAYFVTFSLGLLIGQDIWQRVGTARSARVARVAGAASALYCMGYAAAGAAIGMAGKVILPHVVSRDAVFSAVVHAVLPQGASGLVIAAALAAIMSTSSGALIASATVLREDVWPGAKAGVGGGEADMGTMRLHLLGLGGAAILCAALMRDVLAALTIAYAVLVGGLAVAILGGIVWRRANIQGAVVSIVVGSLTTLGTMAYLEDIYASLPILLGLGSSTAAFVCASLLFPACHPSIGARWHARLKGAEPNAGILQSSSGAQND
ncbi:sodium:solute symporter family transporter [Novosphingobium clariflavum]|uniref:Sodium:solute symporter n=1 Tax=Novosphingobium clariflavum TaxID=2029884 RepID=A0ABV6SER6_9SPHN|nr:hypothetical protein [Novosphingobium clariflavum]